MNQTPPKGIAILKILRWPLALIASLLISAILLSSFIKQGLGNTPVRNGQWTTAMSIGSTDSSSRLRALVAIAGLLASTREDSMYYTVKEIDGVPLSLNCSYKIKGSEYDANWWSITAYGWDYYLIPNEEKRYSYNNENLIKNEDGSWEIIVSANKEGTNWLPVGASGSDAADKDLSQDFDLLLRLYTPGDAYLNSPDTAPLPQITEEKCV